MNVAASVLEAKSVARKAVKLALKHLSREQKQAESVKICSAVIASSWFQKASNLGIYVHCEKLNEVDTSPILSEALSSGKKCFIPVVGAAPREMDLVQIESLSELKAVPPFNILEVSKIYDDGSMRQNALDVEGGLDLLLMPGLGFDKLKNRLGRGGGYYDTFITNVMATAERKGWSPPTVIALAFKCQLLDSIPTSETDRKVEHIVTEDGLF